MLQKLSKMAWRYVFWRAEHDYSIVLSKKVLPGLLLVLFFVQALFNVLPQSPEFDVLYFATACLSTFIYLETYGEYIYKKLKGSYRPKYYVSYNYDLITSKDGGDTE